MRPESIRNSIPGLEFRDLYFAERTRRQSVRQQIGIPVTIITFTSFGYANFASEVDVALWSEGITPVMLFVFALSAVAVGIAVYFLVRTELRFLNTDPSVIEVRAEQAGDPEFFANTYAILLERNGEAERERAFAFVSLLAGLVLFVLALFMLPFHLAGAS